jgi:pimeloyl-ACP methyl ester carboxylesterase
MPSLKRPLRILALAGAAFAGVNLFARYAAGKREDLDPETAGAPGAFLDIEGRRIHYVEAGQGDPVVLIHGWNGSTFNMRYTIPELAQRYRVIAVDLLGYGYSARPADGDYSIGGQVEFVRKVMDRLGVSRAALLGHSMGGAIAIQFALRYPERVERLVLVSSATVREMQRARNWGLLVRPLLPSIAPMFVRESVVLRALRHVVHDPALLTPEMVEGHYRPLRMKGHMRAASKQLSDRRRDQPFDAREICQPALVLWGEHDRVVPLSTGLELAEQIPNAQLAIIRSAGHLAHEEQPEECNRLLLEFLGRAVREESAASSNGSGRESASPVS